jgi:hypothetical protein
LGQPGLIAQLPQQPAKTQPSLLRYWSIDHRTLSPPPARRLPSTGSGASTALPPSLILCLSCASAVRGYVW